MKTSPFKSITFCIFIIFYSLSEGFLLNKKSRSLYYLQMTNELLKFGDKLSISIKVPTKDTRILSSFLSIPHKMIEAAYDKDSITKISDDHYLLKLASLTLPGVDTLTPEIEVFVKYSNGLVTLESGKWTLRGSSNVLKDSRFMQTFEIKLVGQLEVVGDSAANLVAGGWISYNVQGEKPSVFAAAPPFVLDSAIRIIQDATAEFATSHFTDRFQKAFRAHMLSELQVQKQMS